MKKEKLQPEMQRIIRDYDEQLYANKMDNLEEMNKFLERFNLPRLSQEEIKIWTNQSEALKLKLCLKTSLQMTVKDLMVS